MRSSLVPVIAVAASISVPLSARAAAPPIDWNLTPAAISSSCDAGIAQMQASVRSIIVSRTARTFDTVIRPLEDASAELNDALVAQGFLFYVAPDKAVRDASLACDTKTSDVLTEITADPDLYQAVQNAVASNTATTVADRKLQELWIVSLKSSGAALAPQDRAEFVRLQKQLTELQNTFAQNLDEDKSTISIAADQTDGIPADMLASFTAGAGGSYVVPVNDATVELLTVAKNEDVRKAFYVVFQNRGASANVGIFEQAIAVRDRLAHLLGFESWAAYQLADKMAAAPARVEKFLDGLDSQLLPKATAEIETLRRLKAAQTGNPNAVLEPWDVNFENEQLRKSKYSVDAQMVRQYFPVQHTIEAVLGIYHRLLGVDFAQVPSPNVWAPGVREYTVSDSRTHKLLGYTYFDLFPRPGKADGFANYPILPVRVVNGQRRLPVAAIVGNWPAPAPGSPALLGHQDVVTFFHEFGHNMAALLTTAPYETLSSGFRQDFVEAPSQMLENFAWQAAILKQVSSNVTTGAPMPDDLIAKIVASRYVNEAYFTTRQILIADFDMQAHTSGPKIDSTALWQQLAQRVTPMPMYPGTHPQVAFSHLMGGYDAGYYGYLWSLVYAQDMFTAFQQGGLENPTVGMRYRTAILEPARTIEPDVAVEDFLGRPMSPAAFEAQFTTGP